MYSNDISGITDDYLCKRPMRYLFVKEQTVLLINKVLSCLFISYVGTWSFFLCNYHGRLSYHRRRIGTQISVLNVKNPQMPNYNNLNHTSFMSWSQFIQRGSVRSNIFDNCKISDKYLISESKVKLINKQIKLEAQKETGKKIKFLL